MFLYLHGTHIGGLRGFPVIITTVGSQMRMSATSNDSIQRHDPIQYNGLD